MSKPNILVDRKALERNRNRANGRDKYFLHELAISEIKDRLSSINRDFQSIAIVSGLSTPWGQAFPKATIIKDKEDLNLGNGKYDLIIHGMALHWANDPVGQLIQTRLALKNDGLMIAVCLGGTTLNDLRHVFIEAETKLCGGIHPRFMPLAEIRDLGSLMQRAGFALPVADSTTTECLYNGFYKILHDLRGMAETNVLGNRTKCFSRRGLFQYASELYEKKCSRPDRMVSAIYEHIYLTGWAPDPSQQKPLRPGSAQSRLADALRSKESYLPD
mgnify:CR=1 FL=1